MMRRYQHEKWKCFLPIEKSHHSPTIMKNTIQEHRQIMILTTNSFLLPCIWGSCSLVCSWWIGKSISLTAQRNRSRHGIWRWSLDCARNHKAIITPSRIFTVSTISATQGVFYFSTLIGFGGFGRCRHSRQLDISISSGIPTNLAITYKILQFFHYLISL